MHAPRSAFYLTAAIAACNISDRAIAQSAAPEELSSATIPVVDFESSEQEAATDTVEEESAIAPPDIIATPESMTVTAAESIRPASRAIVVETIESTPSQHQSLARPAAPRAETPAIAPPETIADLPVATLATAEIQLESSVVATSPLSPTIESTDPSQNHAQGLVETDPALPPDGSLEDDFLTPDPNAESLDSEELEEELGDVQILPRPAQERPPRQQPNVQLLLRSSAFTSSNVTASELDQEGDVVFVNQATLLATPQLGPNTRLVASAGGGLTRFADETEGNSNSLDLSLGIQQRLAPGMYGQIGWVQDQIFDADDGDRVLLDNSARVLIGRQDQIGENLRLDSSYELRARFTDPEERSRIGNTLGARLRYDFSPDWQGTLGYRLTLDSYTETDRFDHRHQIQATTTYTPSDNTFITGSVSYLFGDSSEDSINPENFSVGINVGVNLSLF